MKPNRELRGMMVVKDVSVSELAKRLAVSHTTMSRKLSGKHIITLWEAYQICKALDIDCTEVTSLFPPETAVPNFAARTKEA